MGDLSPHFSAKEAACPCGCGFIAVVPELVNKLEALRLAADLPLLINSWCRCKDHNKTVGGEPDSAHLTGHAVDIHCPNSRTRFVLLRSAVKLFNRIGAGNSFIHVDCDPSKDPDVVWLYAL